MIAVKEKIRLMNRRRTVTVAADESDGKSGDKVVEDLPPKYSAVSCGHLAPSYSMNSHLSLLGGKYEALIQVDRLVDLVTMVNTILNSSQVLMLEKGWKEYQNSTPYPSQKIKAKLSVQMFRMVHGLEGVTWEEIKVVQSELVLMLNIKCVKTETTTDEKMEKYLHTYQLRRDRRDRKMAKLATMLSRMAKLLRRVNSGDGLRTVPDLDGCLSDCTTCVEEETSEEWRNHLQPVVSLVMDRLQVVMDMVKMVWVEVGMEERLYRQKHVANLGGARGVDTNNGCKDDTSAPEENNLDRATPQLKESCAGEERGGQEGGESGVQRDNSRTDSYRSYDQDSRQGQGDGPCMAGSVRSCQADSDQLNLSSLKEDPCVTGGERLGQAHGDQLAYSYLVLGQDCPPLGSSTPKNSRSLSNCINIDHDNLDTVGKESINISRELVTGLIEREELTRLVEEFAGVEASPRLKMELAKLDMGSGFVKWKSFERRLDDDPGIVFGVE